MRLQLPVLQLPLLLHPPGFVPQLPQPIAKKLGSIKNNEEELLGYQLRNAIKHGCVASLQLQ